MTTRYRVECKTLRPPELAIMLLTLLDALKVHLIYTFRWFRIFADSIVVISVPPTGPAGGLYPEI